MKRALLLLFMLGSCTKAPEPVAASAPVDAGASKPSVTVTSVGPRLLSNQTSNPLSVQGTGLKTGMKLEVGELEVPLTAIDERHAYGRLPAGLKISPEEMQAIVDVKLDGAPTGQKLKVVNDTAFPVLTSLAVSGSTAYVSSVTEDAVYAIDLGTKAVSRIGVGDGPSADSTRSSGA
jgi:hypothetical protein